MPEKIRKPSWQPDEYALPLVTASYFGFIPMVAPKITDADAKAVADFIEHPYYDAVERASFIRTYMEQGFADLPHPLPLIYKRRRGGGYTLHYIGATGALAEATLIRAALSILNDEGYKNLRLELNCIGDKDSQAIHERELTNHIKKFGHNLPEPLKESLKENVFNLYLSEEERAIEFRNNAPSSIGFLTSSARNYFKEVLEYIEGLEIEFGLAPELIGERNHASHTIFGVKISGNDAESSKEHGEYLALGYRYSRLGKKLGMKKEVPMASVTIFGNKVSNTPKVYKELPKPKFYLIQLGREAKIKTLQVLELLRRERIPVGHLLGKDKLSAQLQGAEESKANYLIILGHKEALDGTVTIRNVATRAQDTIPMFDLPQYLKGIKL